MGKLLNSLKNKTKKVLSWTWENILFIETLFLLAFIPLFPKIPILDVKNTWVYVRSEDFIVFFVFLSIALLLIKKKINLRTPLTLPIIIFWIIGGVSTLHGILLIFPKMANVHPNVAFLSLIRHIEYMSLFFVAYHGLSDKRLLKIVISFLVITFLGVLIYGFGQKFLDFPAYLTMNEEFAKGIPIRLSSLSRVPSTFAGHYDLAAYLVLIIPILVSLALGFRNYLVKAVLLGTSFLGFIVLVMTVSRVSFFALLGGLFIVLFFQKRKLVLTLIPIAVVLFMILLSFQSSLFDRFKSTVSQVDVIVDAHSGESLGHVRFEKKEYFKDKLVLQHNLETEEDLAKVIKEAQDNTSQSTSTAIFPYKDIPQEVAVVNAANISTGENLPQGTGYTNLYLSPVTRKVPNFFYEFPKEGASPAASAVVIPGPFLVKRASAYDLSFTTRFQGEWPRAIKAFENNLLIGSGYGSVSLAVDNNYLRMLGEIGLLGFLSFFSIFLIIGIYIKKVYSSIDSKVAKSFILGSAAGFGGLALNASLIDVFEASKIAFILWILAGVNLRLLTLYQTREFSILMEIKKVATAPYSVALYLFLLVIALYSQMLGNYFVGDDFTWLRWVSECDNCSTVSVIKSYFTDAGGFFYRPGTKLYFFIMHDLFWLNQVIYHMVSLLLHFTVALLFFLLLRKVSKNNFIAIGASFIFLILSSYSESVFWISSTGYLFNAAFGLLGLISFILWDEKRKLFYLIAALILFFLALLFQELGVVYPFLAISYKLKDGIGEEARKIYKRFDYLVLFAPLALYLLMRFFAKSHWFSGDYSYDFIKLPFNVIGNIFGYSLTVALGPMAYTIYYNLRTILRENLLISVVLFPLVLGTVFLTYKLSKRYFSPSEKRIIAFGIMFFVLSLLPYLGMGNITSRYSYLASMGFAVIMIVIIKKLYEVIRELGNDIAIGLTSIFVIIFILFHIIQIQQAYFDWREAGGKSKKFFISIENAYSDLWKEKNVELHFVNVPTRVGQAWLFPVGLPDAVWFAFKDPSIRVFKHTSVEEARRQAGYSKTSFILEFSETGVVTLVDHSTTSPVDLIKNPQVD